MNLPERVGQNIQDVRRARGLSQEALSFSAGLSRSYMGKLENGKNAMSLTALEKIANALGVDPSELVKPRTNRK
ncbi:helix-turn-helix transcriptional regulator [Aliiroseovarius subalbicans]|uniref:helix-turn-helix domain-containing protein n=1 Tax=Aliiroseovarius subalbicans TaxID=2925840 RepID=UPI001F58EA36|nr:helix-turn-helix transcriptional regulator [Aliiroseovarius subalbicans]MCI2401021.1 helix-turn-helix domain-containing protein [Aliiroseovarius subalbicans]